MDDKEVVEVIYDGGSKFMWDGEIYESPEEAANKKKEYEGDEFEVRVVEKGGKHLVYTRRVVTEVLVEGPPPP